MRSQEVIARPAGRSSVWVEDRLGTVLPYSKGLMAASIMATGLPPGRAYELASMIDDELRTAGERRASSEELIEAAARVLRRHAGHDIANRYLAWRRAKRSPKPIVVLIGGATGVGKSTVATKLAARLDLTRVVTTDTVREIMKCFLGPDDAPEIHRSSFEARQPDPIPHFMRQAATVSSGIAGLIERMVTERKDVIVEGVHLVPGTVTDARIQRLHSDAAIIQVLLVLDNPVVHRSHFLYRLDNEHGRDAQRYLRGFDAIRRVQRHLIDLAEIHGIPTVDAESLDDAIQAVVDRVVAEVVSPSQAPREAVAI